MTTELTFKSDTKHRKQFFTGVSFSHPAKMVLPLQLWLIENYTQPGEVILDCMAGSGTCLVACAMGRHVITVELEQKFIDMQKGNWAKIQERGPMMGYQMGTAQIIQGDARNLPAVLCDKIISSPPYAEQIHPTGESPEKVIATNDPKHLGQYSQPMLVNGYGNSAGNISSLPYGSIDKVITSPPYEASVTGKPGIDWSKCDGGKRDRTREPSIESIKASMSGYTVDAILTSPPYEGTEARDRSTDASYREDREQTHAGGSVKIMQGYQAAAENIGNLKSTSYLEAMALVYANCHAVLKVGGLMVLVTKNFIRNRKEVRLDEDTIKLVTTCHRMLYCNCETNQSTELQQRENLLSMPEADNQHGDLLHETQTTGAHEASYTGSKSQDKSKEGVTGYYTGSQAENKRESKTILAKQETEAESLSDLRSGDRPQSQKMSAMLPSNSGIPGQNKQGTYGKVNPPNHREKSSQLEGGNNPSRPQEIDKQPMAANSQADSGQGQSYLPDVRKDGESSSRDNSLDTGEPRLQRQQPDNSLYQLPYKSSQITEEATQSICSHCHKPKVPKGKTLDDIGFTFKERHYRKLTTQSFWRTIYRQKYPDAPVLNKEDILVFERF